MLAKALIKPGGVNWERGWRRRNVRLLIGRIRWRLACWVVGYDLGDR